MSPRSFWAVVNFAESSLVDATFKPVVIRFEVMLSDLVVDVRLWRAAIAPLLVLTERAMIHSFLDRRPLLRPGSEALTRDGP